MGSHSIGWRCRKRDGGAGRGLWWRTRLGQVYFATPLGVQMCEANGRMAAVLNPPAPGEISSVVFAGKKRDWIYVAEGGRLFRRPVKVTGVTAGIVVQQCWKPPL